MTPQLQETLAALAQKLGTTVEHLWPVLVARQRLDACLGIVCGFGFGLALAYAVYYIFKNYDDLDDMFPAALSITLGGLASLILIIMGFCNITNAVYPEVAALQSLIPGK